MITTNKFNCGNFSIEPGASCKVAKIEYQYPYGKRFLICFNDNKDLCCWIDKRELIYLCFPLHNLRERKKLRYKVYKNLYSLYPGVTKKQLVKMGFLEPMFISNKNRNEFFKIG